jgi:hypothetical protein
MVTTMFVKPNKVLFNDNWQFMGKELNSLFPGIDDEGNWADVEIPHDRLVWSNRESVKSRDGWYKKAFTLTADEAKQSVQVTFDGVYAECSVYVNDTLVLDECDEGNLGFTLEIGNFTRAGENVIHVGVRHTPESVSASGEGIYRNVWLTKQHKIHILSPGEGGGIRAAAVIRADAPWKVRVGVEYTGEADAIRYFLYNPDGEQIDCAEASGDYIFELCERSAVLWTLENPRLYSLKVQLIKRDRVIDQAGDTFAFRTVGATTDGFILLNGCAVRLCCVRIGDNYGALGAAFNVSAARRQLKALKQVGANAVSAADGCLAPEVYKLCDETGLLIVDSADADDAAVTCETLFDSTGYPKPAYYYYKAIWAKASAENEPYIKIFPHWDWNIGQTVEVTVYSNMKKTELFLGNKSLGRQITDWVRDDVQCAAWTVKYECGELIARAYDHGGGIAAIDRASSFWDATVLKAEYDTDEPLRANGRDLKFIDIFAYDEAGEFVGNANNRVTVEVSGAARLLGFDNGDPCDYDSFKCDNRRLFGGRATAIIQTALEEGQAYVEISSRGLKETLLVIDIGKAEPGETVGISVADNDSYYEFGYGEAQRRSYTDEVPARKVELVADKTRLSENNPSAKIKAEIFPADSDYTNVTWFCSFDDEFDLDYEDVQHLLKIEGSGIWCRVSLTLTEIGIDEDGDEVELEADLSLLPPRFRVCACCRGSDESSQVVSEIELTIDN